MKTKYLTIALIAGFALAPLAWAQGEEENGTAGEAKVVAKVLPRKMPNEIPGKKMTEQQWKVQPHFFDQHNDSTEEMPDPVRVLREHHGIDFPGGATASYSPKNGKLTVKNTPRNLKLIDDAIRDYISNYGLVGRTAEDFKKWAKQEYKRRQTAVELMKKVHDAKSSEKAFDKLMKIYNAKKTRGTRDCPIGNLRLSYKGTLKVIDPKTRDAVGKKFAKQLEEIYDQQNRLSELEFRNEIEALLWYTECIYVLAQDDKTGESWYITKLGVEVKRAGESDD